MSRRLPERSRSNTGATTSLASSSHSRFLGLRLHLVCALSGLPVAFALTGAKADERETLLGMLDADPNLLATHPAQTLMADKNY